MEYLQEVARVRLCLDLAADFLSELQEASGKSPWRCFSSDKSGNYEEPDLRIRLSSFTRGLQRAGPGTLAGFVFTDDIPVLSPWLFPKLTELTEEKQRFLKQVEQFCTRVKNDWHRVYLLRRLSSQCGMEFMQSFLQQGHPCQWVFPRDVLAQQVRSRAWARRACF